MAKIITSNGQISSSAPIDIKIGASSSLYIGYASIGIGTSTPDSALDIENGYITLPELAIEPSTQNITPGKGALYLSGTDSRIYFKNDLGDVFDLTKSGSAPITVTPGGINTSIQFNSGSTFSGSSDLIYDYTTNALSGTIARFTTITGSRDSLINGITIGRGSGNALTNTVLGNSALSVNTTGISNLANGYQCLNVNSVGNYNVAIGTQALRSNTSGSYNVAVGANDGAAPPPLGSNTTGNGNVAIGQMTLGNNVSGDFNVAVGREALKKNTASSNTAVGLQALLENTTGTQNCAVGAIALTNNSTGGSNSAFGRQALAANTNGSFNTALGVQAGVNLNTGSYNLFLGYQAGTGETNLSDTVIIRANSERMRIDSNGNFGIAKTSPNARLDVNGSAIVSGNLNVTGSITASTAQFTNVTSGFTSAIANVSGPSSVSSGGMCFISAASIGYTITLPSPVAGGILYLIRTDATGFIITISGHINGIPGSNNTSWFPANTANRRVVLVSNGTSWYPIISGTVV